MRCDLLTLRRTKSSRQKSEAGIRKGQRLPRGSITYSGEDPGPIPYSVESVGPFLPKPVIAVYYENDFAHFSDESRILGVLRLGAGGYDLDYQNDPIVFDLRYLNQPFRFS